MRLNPSRMVCEAINKCRSSVITENLQTSFLINHLRFTHRQLPQCE